MTDGRYNGSRSIFYTGTPTGEGMYSDGSGLHTRQIEAECGCPPSDLVVAPEDVDVARD